MKKYNYSEKFYRDNFLATVSKNFSLTKLNQKLLIRKEQVKRNEKYKYGTIKPAPTKYEKLLIKNLIPNIKFVQKNHLNTFSNPAD